MGFALGFHGLEGRDVFGHGVDLCAGEFLDHGVAFHVVAVGVAAEKDFDVGEFEAELFDVGFDDGHSLFEVAVDEDEALRGADQIRAEDGAADVINVADDFKRRERAVHLIARAEVAGENFFRGGWDLRGEK